MKNLERINIGLTMFLGNFLGKLSGWMVAIMMVLVAFEVFMRYVLNKPPLIADEFAAYLLVAVSYLGIAYTFMEGGHVRITFLVSKVPPKVAKWLRLFTLIIGEIFVIVMCIACYQYLSFSIMINEKSATWLNFPLKYPQATLLIGFFVYALVLLAKIYNVMMMPAKNESAVSE
jgi:TRAP-type C4-dicarboxylate transport system permease small subunit